MHIVPSDPKSRIEGWLVQVEHIAQMAITELKPKIASSWRGARAAHSRLAGLEALARSTGHPNDIAAAERALRDERHALERA